MRSQTLAAAVVAGYLLVYLVPLGVRPLMIVDEVRYAEIPREMIASGDWIVPRVNGLRYFEKPVLGYWLNALSIRLFGENPFAVRLPSALAAGATALILFFFAYRSLGDGESAFFVPAVFLTVPLVFTVGTYNVLDSIFSALVTATVAALYFAYREPAPRRRSLLLALAGGACGLAFLTKGFLAFALPAAAFLPFLFWEGRWRERFRFPWPALLALAAVVLPWSLAIHRRENGFWNFFFFEEHVRRYFSAEQSQHPEPAWFFLPILVWGSLPWTAMIPAAVIGLRKRILDASTFRLAACWFLFPLLFLSASRGKLATYILPVLPPFALLLAAGLTAYLKAGGRRAFSGGAAAAGTLMGLVAVGLAVNQMTGFPVLRLFGPGETPKFILALLGLLAWAGLPWLAVRFDRWRARLWIYSAAPVLFLFLGPFVVPDRFKIEVAAENFLRRHAPLVRPDSLLISDGHLVHAVCWWYHRTDVRLLKKIGEFEYGLSYPGEAHRKLGFGDFKRLVKENAGKDRVILIVDSGRYERFRPDLPPAKEERIQEGLAFIRY